MKNKKIIILSGKARAGKDTTMNYLYEFYDNIIQLQYGSYIKEYAKKISNWDGSEISKPRQLLQYLGTDLIRKEIDEKFFIKKMIEDIKVYSYFFEYIVISDARFKIEIDDIKECFDNVFTVRIKRPNFDNGLTEEQKMHPSEIDLDDYPEFDYELINDGTLDDLKNKVEKLVEVIDMNLKDLYINFFVSKGHKWIPSAPVVPENDPSVLFNTAGMQPLIPYLTGQPHPYGTRLCDYQKCIRTNDLDSIGDKTHHTFFEMLGNWSLGDYFKEESINYSFEFLTQVLKIPVEKLAVSVFAGDKDIPRDDVSANVWKSLGIKEERIAYLDAENNFWIAGTSGPCGGDTEIFYFRSNDEIPEKFDPQDDRWVEIWNNVFMQYYKDESGKITELPKKNVDTGMGLERVAAVLEGVDDNYMSSVWKDVIELIEKISNLPYKNNEESMRIIADHIRTAVFISADPAGIKPSNTDQGYILRRLIRRSIRHAKKLNIDINSNWEQEIALLIMSKYENYYNEIKENKNIVLDVLKNEKIKFNKTLEKGLREFEKITSNIEQTLNKDLAFKLYDTYGFPIELTIELANELNITVDVDGFNEKFREHQELSRTASSGKFKGGLAGNSEIETKYHTATHLLNAALKIVVNKDVHQKGSNITSERMRFDFSCDHKLTDEEKQKTENLVNEWIQQGLTVVKEEMSKEEAIKSGAECMFIEKYPDIVTVYSIGDVSKELCGGPHVSNTSSLGKFKIQKEEASSAGVRRIKAVLE